MVSYINQQGLTVALFWPARVWFSDLVSLLDGFPLQIAIRRAVQLFILTRSVVVVSLWEETRW